jgi:acetolactate synthase I/II/III large subunit
MQVIGSNSSRAYAEVSGSSVARRKPVEWTAGHSIVAALEAAEVDRVFGIPGGAISSVVDALLDSDIEFVACQQESMAVYAALGYARATGRLGVVAVTSGPGVLNALTGVAASRLDEGALLLLVGEAARSSRGRVALQDGSETGIDIGRMTAPLVKYTHEVVTPASAATVVAEAIQHSLALPQGPSIVRIPVDVGRSRCGLGEVFVAPDQLPLGLPSGVAERIAGLLARAKRPAIMFGGRAYRGGAWEAGRTLAKRIGCAVFTDLEGKGVFPESDPQSLGVFGIGSLGRAEEVLSKGVDFLLLVGTRLDDTTTANFSPLLRPEGATVVHIDYSLDRVNRSYEVDLAVRGDIRVILHRITESLPPVLAVKEPLLSSAPPSPLPFLMGPVHDPRDVPVALRAAFPEDTVFTTDIGNHLIFAAQQMQFDLPGQFHASMGLGGMGSGLGVGIGLAFGLSDRRVVVICGDGSLLMSGSEISTCARYGIPLVVAVFNDGQWGMVAHGSSKVYGRSHDWSLPSFDVKAYAESLGAACIRVQTNQDLAVAASWAESRPLILDIPIDPSVRVHNPRDATLNFSDQ